MPPDKSEASTLATPSKYKHPIDLYAQTLLIWGSNKAWKFKLWIWVILQYGQEKEQVRVVKQADLRSPRLHPLCLSILKSCTKRT